MNVIPTEADRVEFEIAESLGLDPDRIIAGSLRAEIIASQPRARVSWDGFAFMDAEALMAIVNRGRVIDA